MPPGLALLTLRLTAATPCMLPCACSPQDVIESSDSGHNGFQSDIALYWLGLKSIDDVKTKTYHCMAVGNDYAPATQGTEIHRHPRRILS